MKRNYLIPLVLVALVFSACAQPEPCRNSHTYSDLFGKEGIQSGSTAQFFGI